MDRKRPPPSPNKAPLASSSSSFIAYTTILPTFLFSISQIILHAIVPQVIVELVCLHESGSMDCDGSDVSGKASVINFLSATIISIPNVFVIGFYASFSRRYGLKPTLLTPVIGNFLFLLFVYLAKIWTSWYKPLIMLGSLISGLSGSRNTFMLATFAYAADVSEPQERSNVFSIIESAIYLARVVCPLTIGVLSHRYGFGFTLLLGILVCFANLCWINFVMRDPGAVTPAPLSDHSPRQGLGWVGYLSRCCWPSRSSTTGDSNTGGVSQQQNDQNDHNNSGSSRSGSKSSSGSSSGSSNNSNSASRDGTPRHEGVAVSNTSPVPLSVTVGNSTSGYLGGLDESDSNCNNHINASISSSSSSVSISNMHMRDLNTETVLPPLTHPHIAAQLSIGAARPSEKLAWHPLETFRSVAKLFGKNRSIGNDTTPFIAFTYFVYHMVVVGVHTVEILFVKYVFKWGADSIGLFGSIHGLMEILSMLAMPIVVSKVLLLSLNDLNWIEVGLFSRALFFGLFGVVRTGSELFFILTLLVLCGPVVPRIKSYLSKSVDPRHSSDLFAALAGIDAISAFVSPLFTAVYFHTLTVYPGFVFELVALLFVLCALIIMSVRRGFGRDMMGVVMDYLPMPIGDKSRASAQSDKNRGSPVALHPHLVVDSALDDLFKGKGPLTTSYSNVHLNRTSSSGTVSKAVIAAYPLVSTNSVPDLKDKDKG